MILFTLNEFFFIFNWILIIFMICFCTEFTFLNESAYFYCVIIMLILIAVNDQTAFVKYFHIIKYFLQNKFFLNENVHLSENHHIYNQNVCFDAVSCIFLAVFNMQYFHHIMNSEILCVDFCHNHLLIWLIDHVLDHMLNHYCETDSDHTSLWF